jgi:hypothetical protein
MNKIKSYYLIGNELKIDEKILAVEINPLLRFFSTAPILKYWKKVSLKLCLVFAHYLKISVI